METLTCVLLFKGTICNTKSLNSEYWTELFHPSLLPRLEARASCQVEDSERTQTNTRQAKH